MNPKKSPRQRPRLSFAVDREEIDISSDWVEAVMESPEPQSPFFPPETKTTTVESLATVAEPTTVELNATVDVISTVAPVATVEPISTVASVATVALSSRARIFRPRLIRRVSDGLTAGQFNVYIAMSSRSTIEDGLRLYRGGYNDICAQTGLSKRGVQNIIAELIEKAVIFRHQAPGYHRSQVSVYRVLSDDEIVQTWHSQALRYAVGKSKTLTHSATVALQATS